jgi:7-cyano-7-deazaguanine synthase
VVLLSGGMDSATCLAMASRATAPVDALTVFYGQRHARELRSARALAKHFGVRHHSVVRLPVGSLLRSALTSESSRLPHPKRRAPDRIPPTYVPARNTILLALALGYAESERLPTIYIGANAVDYSGYPDCRPAFIQEFTRLSRLATRVGVEEGWSPRVRAPLLKLTKAEIVRRGKALGVPWAQTWSCYSGGGRPCGRCAACRIRARGFREAGVRDPLVHR